MWRSKRRHDHGFTLLEALLAAAVLAMLAVPIMSAFGRALEQGQPRIAAFEAHEFAVSVLAERSATRNFTPETGLYENRFRFDISAAPHPPLESTRYDDLIHFTELTVTVTDQTQAEGTAELSQVFAHRPR